MELPTHMSPPSDNNQVKMQGAGLPTSPTLASLGWQGGGGWGASSGLAVTIRPTRRTSVLVKIWLCPMSPSGGTAGTTGR